MIDLQVYKEDGYIAVYTDDWALRYDNKHDHTTIEWHSKQPIGGEYNQHTCGIWGETSCDYSFCSPWKYKDIDEHRQQINEIGLLAMQYDITKPTESEIIEALKYHVNKWAR